MRDLFECGNKTCPKIEKDWFLLVCRVEKQYNEQKNPDAVVRRCSVK